MHTHPHRPPVTRTFAPGLILLALLSTGCSQRTASEPEARSSQSASGALLAPIPPIGPASGEQDVEAMFHMPLAIGNRWDYVVQLRTRLVVDGVTVAASESESPLRSEIVSEQEIGGVGYFMQIEYDPRVVPPEVPQFALRQDRSGLYHRDLVFVLGTTAAREPIDARIARFEADAVALAANSPHRGAVAAAARRLAERLALIDPRGGGRGVPGLPGNTGLGAFRGFRGSGPLPEEISLLRYPLFRGSHWIVRDSPHFSRAVIGRERTILPAGEFATWVMRGDAEFYGPNTRVRFWQAREGLVQIEILDEQEVTDVEGNVGRLFLEWRQSLSALTLVETLQ